MVHSPYGWYGHQLQQVLLRPSLVAMAVVILTCLFNFQKLNWRISRREIEIYLFALVAFVVSYSFGIGVVEENSKYIEKLLKINIFVFFLVRSIYEFKYLKMLIWILISGGLFLCFQAYQIGSYYDGRLNSIGGADFSEANAFAAFVAVCIVLLGFKLFKQPPWKKILLILPLPIMLNTLILAQSRAVFLGFAFAFVFIIFKSPASVKKEILVYSFLAAILFTTLAHDKFWERMGTIDDQAGLIGQTDPFKLESEELSRLDFWSASFDIFRDYPMGIGVKNFQVIVPSYDPRNKGLDAHNTYVLCYTEIGIIGIIVFLLILFEAFLQLKRVIKRIKIREDSRQFEMYMVSLAFFSILILFFFGAGVTHSYLYSEFTWILLTLPICLENALRFQKPDN